MKKTLWILFVFLSILVGIFPFIFYALNVPFGITNIKTEMILSNLFWKIGFHIHIIFAAVALLIGWMQFISKLRIKSIKIHKGIGKIYIVSVLISALAGFYISFYANGGISAFLGLLMGSVIWFITTFMSYYYIRQKRIDLHKAFTIYSYAFTFGGVTLRIWLPLLVNVLNDFNMAYDIAVWLAWLPNILVAYFINVRSSKTNSIKR